VFIVTGSSSGVGKELAQILYSHDAKVYIAVRSEERATEAINVIKARFPDSKGELAFLHLDLGDLTTIKKSAEEFLAKESKLDVLWNNAGVMVPPQNSKTKQGYELQLGTNNVGPFLFTKLLMPLLIKTAKTAPANSIRVVWVSSSMAELSPKGGVELDNLNYKKDKSTWTKYAVSKAGNWYHSTEYAKRCKEDGVVSVVSLKERILEFTIDKLPNRLSIPAT
jgi:retinol dehydrogenase-12